jgi:hypothetical protein
MLPTRTPEQLSAPPFSGVMRMRTREGTTVEAIGVSPPASGPNNQPRTTLGQLRKLSMLNGVGEGTGAAAALPNARIKIAVDRKINERHEDRIRVIIVRPVRRVRITSPNKTGVQITESNRAKGPIPWR